MKRIICFALMLAMLLTALPAMAENVRTSGDFQYTIKGNGTATIVGYTGEHADIILPNLIDGYPITTIGEGAFLLDNTAIDGVSPYGDIPSISVTIPNTVTSIEGHAFAYRNVRSINIPDTAEYIGYGAFLGSPEINFRLSNSHPYFATINGSLYNKTSKELLQWVQGSNYGEAVVVPEGILSIGDYAFADMSFSSAVDFSLPQSLKKIGSYAFSNTYYDGNLVIPASVSEIGAYAFEGAGIDVDISLCTQLETISERAFASTDDNNGITDVPRLLSAPQNIKNIEAYAFYRSAILDLDNLLANVEMLGAYAFSEMGTGGVAINIPGTCKVVGEGAFYKAYNVCEINIAQGVERIEAKAFLSEGYGFVENVYLPSSLSYIALDAFDKEVTYVVEKGSYAERWVRDNAFTYTINGEEQDLSWLNS